MHHRTLLPCKMCTYCRYVGIYICTRCLLDVLCGVGMAWMDYSLGNGCHFVLTLLQWFVYFEYILLRAGEAGTVMLFSCWGICSLADTRPASLPACPALECRQRFCVHYMSWLWCTIIIALSYYCSIYLLLAWRQWYSYGWLCWCWIASSFSCSLGSCIVTYMTYNKLLFDTTTTTVLACLLAWWECYMAFYL